MFCRRIMICILTFGLVNLTGCTINHSKPAQPSAERTYSADRFVVAGSGTNLPVTRKLAEAYQTKFGLAIEIPPSIGTDGATIALDSGALELGLISRPLTSGEVGKGLKIIPYAKVGIVFATPVAVPDTNMTAEELLKIHQGIKNTWSNGKPIFVIIREKHDSSNQVLYQLIPGWKDAIFRSIDEKRWQIAYKDAEVPRALLNTAWSVGLTDTTETMQHKNTLRSLWINGVPPDPTNIANGTYPFSKELSFAYKGILTERAKHFIEFVRSQEGKTIIATMGAVPVAE